MQKTLVLLSIGYKNAENHFLLFMNNKIAQGRPSYICYLKFLTFMTKV